jgi:phosphonate transport system substrate-binding protein
MPAQFINDAFDPFIQFINRKKVGITVKVVMCQSYKEYNEKMRNGFFDIVFANPADALDIMNNGYSVFAKLSRDDMYRAVIITRKDSRINTVTDLKNCSISFPGPTAFAGTMLPLYFLYQHGLNVNQDIKPLYVASQESTFYNVFLGKSVAAGCWIMPWKNFQKTNPDIASKLCVKWETPALISSPIMARNNLDTLYLGKFKKILFTLQDNPEGRKLLESISLGNFIAASNTTYDPAKAFLKKYHSVIHL